MLFGRAKQRFTRALALWIAVGAYGSAQTTVIDPPSRFAVTTVRLSAPGTGTHFSPRGVVTFTATNASLTGLLVTAFGVRDAQISGLPKWAETAHYDVTAKPEGDKPFSDVQFRQALQQLIKERLHLEFHHETKMVDGYRLVVGKNGAKLTPSKGGFAGRTEFADEGSYAYNVTLDDFSSALSPFVLSDPVENDTGIKGSFEIKLKFAKIESADSALPSIFTAVQEQLGLKLERAKVPVDVIVVDHIDREPTEN